MKETAGKPHAEELEKIRAFLGEAAAGYSDGQLPQLYRDIFTMAELLLDFYLTGKQLKPDRVRPHLTNCAPELPL